MSLVTSQYHSQGDGSTTMAWPLHIASRQATAYGNARALRRAILAGLTTTERALLWRWCIGVTMVYGALFSAFLAILVLVTHIPLSSP